MFGRMRSANVLSIVLAMGVAGTAFADLVDRAGRPPPPGPAECGGDRVAGVWRGRHFLDGVTYITTLYVERAGGNSLRGRMDVLSFTGRGRPPPPCQPGQRAYRVTQPSVGTADGLRVDFRATSVEVVYPTICGAPGGYAADHFTGTIEANASVLRAVNNDGGVAVNEPVAFRRVRCR